jgi:Fe-S cluster biogenesis protein NfuA
VVFRSALRTLFLRVRHASATALAVARHFHGHPALNAVLYPGLPSHPGHETAARQMTGGFGGMLSFRVAGGQADALAVAGAVRVFKRGTSLGGVESLIEHRRSTEGPSSPVPDDLLRLSIGLEAPEDLIDDLEAAVAEASNAGAARRPTAVTEISSVVPAPTEVEAAIRAAVERSVAPTVIARGGTVRIAGVAGGVVTLEASGSPGAIVPAAAQIEALLRAAVPEITQVRIVWPGPKPTPDAGSDLSARVARILDDLINPAVAAHRGRVSLVEVRDGRARIRLEGGCQGCSQAEVTVRQGIERLLRERLPEIAAVVDVTEHAAATDPFFPPGKR